MNDHPGGKDSILLYAGQDATEQFVLIHQELVLRKYGPKILIGKLISKKLSENKTLNNDKKANNYSNIIIEEDHRKKIFPSSIPRCYPKTGDSNEYNLPQDRKKTSFDLREVTHYLNMEEEMTKK